MGRRVYFPSVAFLCLSISGCSSGSRIPVVEQTKMAMGTFFTVALYGPVETHRAEEAISAAFDTIEAVEAWASGKLPGSEISLLAQYAGKETVRVSSDLDSLLRLAQQVSSASEGAFDVTVGALTHLWGFEDSPSLPPDSGAVDSARALVGYRELCRGPRGVFLPRPGMRLDLGAIAKGWAVDRAFELLRARGFADLVVDGGGDLRIASSSVTAGKRRVWVRHPRRAGEYFARFPLDSGAVATSGDYERYFLCKGRRFHHILDPRTGWPAWSCASVTVTGPSTALCDAWATAIFVLGPEKGLQAARRIPGLQALVVSEHAGRLYWEATEELAAILEVLDAQAVRGFPSSSLSEP
ncbi:MAG: FAD:protein FMN transferase [candidate division KSB1 bacterium]|nr:FAD:protein FMN transferase [candidate division KSB1 bacterium]